jgi:hypothetical protein
MNFENVCEYTSANSGIVYFCVPLDTELSLEGVSTWRGSVTVLQHTDKLLLYFVPDINNERGACPVDSG